MGKLSLAVVTFAAVTLLGAHPSQAYGNAPWCAVVSVDQDAIVEQCVFADLETCRQEVIAGNRGFCNQNPRWAGYAPTPAKRLRKRVHH
jgi:hypothetical protein